MRVKTKRRINLKKRGSSRSRKNTRKIHGGNDPDKCSDIIKAIHDNNIELLETTTAECDVNGVVDNPISSPRFKNMDVLTPIQWMSIYYNSKSWWEEGTAAEKFTYETDTLKKMHIPRNNPQAPQKSGLDLVCEFDNLHGFLYYNSNVLQSQGDSAVDSYYYDRPQALYPQQTAAYYGSSKVLDQMVGDSEWNPARYREVNGIGAAPPLYLAVKGFFDNVNPRDLTDEQRYKEYLESVTLILNNINDDNFYSEYVDFNGTTSMGYTGQHYTMEILVREALTLPFKPNSYKDKFLKEVLRRYFNKFLIEARGDDYPNIMQYLVTEVLSLLPDQVGKNQGDYKSNQIEPTERARRRVIVYDALLSVRENTYPTLGEIELKKLFMRDAEKNAPYALEYLIENEGYMTPSTVAQSRIERRKEMVDRVATGMTSREIEEVDPETGKTRKVTKSMPYIGPDATKLIKKFVTKGGKKGKGKYRKTQKKLMKYKKRKSHSKITRKK